MTRMVGGFCRVMFQRETLTPVLALAGVSVVAITLVGIRMGLTHSLRHGYLIWNLFLAWLPLFFCLAAVRAARTQRDRQWKFWALATAWLLFLPNAPYIFTDLIHLGRRLFWVDLVLIVLCAWTASVLGFLSLYLMQTMVRRRRGVVASWAFVVFVSGLTGLGIYIGRFLRWNTWDLLLNPFGVASDVGWWLITALSDKKLAIYPALFALLFFAAHVTLSSLLHVRLQPAENEPNRA
jgi:uncharacterized membrane protein